MLVISLLTSFTYNLEHVAKMSRNDPVDTNATFEGKLQYFCPVLSETIGAILVSAVYCALFHELLPF